LEYGLIAALIACFIIAGVTYAGEQVLAVFNFIANAISGSMTTAPAG
jgi:Flp pilus assembly pilin Flp